MLHFSLLDHRFLYSMWISSNRVLEPALDEQLDYFYTSNKPFDPSSGAQAGNFYDFWGVDNSIH